MVEELFYSSGKPSWTQCEEIADSVREIQENLVVVENPHLTLEDCKEAVHKLKSHKAMWIDNIKTNSSNKEEPSDESNTWTNCESTEYRTIATKLVN